MKTPPDRFRDDALGPALDAAIAGDRATLYDKLRRVSGLPGPRVNVGLVKAFAGEAGRRGAPADRLIAAMLSTHDDIAPFGHVDEILPILGVAATGVRAAADARARKGLLESLEEAACDMRTRVREEVATALITIGVAVGVPFVEVLRRWIDDDQPYLSRAAVVALTDPALLTAVGAEGASTLLEAALMRVAREHRGGRRHDAYRKLCRAMETMPAAVVNKHPIATEVLLRLAVQQEPGHASVWDDEDARNAIENSVEQIRRGRHGERAQALADALASSKKPSRDPRWDRLPGKRGRSKKL